VKEDIEFVIDDAGPAGEIKVTVSCWKTVFSPGATREKGWLVAPATASPLEIPDAIGTQALGVEAVAFGTVHVRTCNCREVLSTRSWVQASTALLVDWN